MIELYRKIRLLVKSYIYLPKTVVIVANGSSVSLNTRNWVVANVVFWLGGRNILDYEPDEISLIMDRLKNINTFWDIGSQIGYYSFLAKLCGVKNVLAADISSNGCKSIEENAERNKMEIKVINMPVGINGKETYYSDSFGKWSGKAISFDILWKTTGKPDLIKMDIEGGEKDALLGGKELLSRSDAPDLFIEFNEDVSDLEELKNILQNYGYHLEAKGTENQLWIK